MQKTFRQGDILIIEASAVPLAAQLTQNRVIAYGESTGHAHVVEGDVTLFGDTTVQWIVSNVPFRVIHDEHTAVDVPAGTFRVIRQREYSPDRIRNIAD